MTMVVIRGIARFSYESGQKSVPSAPNVSPSAEAETVRQLRAEVEALHLSLIEAQKSRNALQAQLSEATDARDTLAGMVRSLTQMVESAVDHINMDK